MHFAVDNKRPCNRKLKSLQQKAENSFATEIGVQKPGDNVFTKNRKFPTKHYAFFNNTLIVIVSNSFSGL